MKFLIMLGATALGVWLGMTPKLGLPRPTWWKILAILSLFATIVFGLLPPIGGTFTDVVMVGRMDSTKYVPWYATVGQLSTTNENMSVVLTDARDSRVKVEVGGEKMMIAELAAQSGRSVIIQVRRADNDRTALALLNGPILYDPNITLPYIVGLEERARIIFFHVPMSWIATVAYLISMIYAVGFLRNRNIENDTRSMAAASVGTLFAFLATITGAVWAKFNWGSFWNWDPRETSIFLLLLVYGAYFLLRGSIEDQDKRARLSAAYSIVAFVTVPFLVFILPRLLPGLHPGSADDTNAGPLLSPKSDAINVTKQIVFGLSLFSFTLVFYWMMNMKIRLESILIRTKRGIHQ